jgi:transketolase
MDTKSRKLRRMMVEAVRKAGRGHLPSAFSCIEIIRVLYDGILRVRADEPEWTERDRFILSKGHGCLALYVALAAAGVIPESELDTFCAYGSILGGHPERRVNLGVEASTGSLGHGPSLAVGMGLAARLDGNPARFFVLCGDGECNEGSVWEACLSAAKHKLDSLTLLIDYNKQQSWDAVDAILPLEPLADKFRAFGLEVAEVDGHDIVAMRTLFSSLPLARNKPSCVLCHTVKGKGISFLEGNLAWHHKSRLTDGEYQSLIAGIETYPAGSLPQGSV